MNKTIILLLLAAACLAAGCTANRVIFSTHTSLGLDVSGTAQMPDKVSFSYNRFEGAIVPRKTNSEAHSVYGGMDADIHFFDSHTIKQTFATGKAAMLATGADTADVVTSGGKVFTNNYPLVFLTATTFGLHLTAGEQQMSPNLLMGYRRSEAAVVPVPDPAEEVRSVYADLLINSAAATNTSALSTNFSALRGVRIKQSFATGRAAESLVQNNSEVKLKLDQAAGLDATRAILRQQKDQASGLVKGIGSELDRLQDAKLSEAVTALKSARVFSAGDFANTDDLRRRIKAALALKIEDDYSDPTTVQQLTDGLTALKNIQN